MFLSFILAALIIPAAGSSQTVGTFTTPDDITVNVPPGVLSASVEITISTTASYSDLTCQIGDTTYEAGQIPTLTFSRDFPLGPTSVSCYETPTGTWAYFTVNVVDPPLVVPNGCNNSNFVLTAANGSKMDRNLDGYVCKDAANNGNNGKAVTDNKK